MRLFDLPAIYYLSVFPRIYKIFKNDTKLTLIFTTKSVRNCSRMIVKTEKYLNKNFVTDMIQT